MKSFFERFKRQKREERSIKSVASNKKAILIGLNYPGSHYSLNGCVNDIKNGSEYLSEGGYDVKMLTDNEVSKKYNVLEALSELGKSSSKNLFFHYSGHGTRIRDTDGDEEDGYDEVVYSKDGVMIVDDQINAEIALYPKDKTVFLIFDCCHSGSIVDLPYIYTDKNGVKTEKTVKNVSAKVIAISGCRDNQTSADITKNGMSFGALSSTLYSLLRKYRSDGKEVTWKQLYFDLLVEMRKKRYVQYPILSASHPTLFYEKVHL